MPVDSCTKQQRSHEDINIAYRTYDSFIEYLAVYDGHGGARELHTDHIAYVLAYGYLDIKPLHYYVEHNLRVLDKSGINTLALKKSAISLAFDEFNAFAKARHLRGGSCAAIVIILSDMVFACHVGDSRIVIWTHDEKLYESLDHTPTRLDEHERILNSDGYVVGGRLNGNLAVSRAFGDFDLEPSIICTPHILAMKLEDSTKLHILILSDAFYDNTVGRNTDYISMIKSLPKGLSVSRALVDFSSLHTTDDTTALYYQYRKIPRDLGFIDVKRAPTTHSVLKTRSEGVMRKASTPRIKSTKEKKISKSSNDMPSTTLSISMLKSFKVSILH